MSVKVSSNKGKSQKSAKNGANQLSSDRLQDGSEDDGFDESKSLAFDLPAIERQILERWKQDKSFEESARVDAPLYPRSEKRVPRPAFSFYDGPPFATGLPHFGHLLAGTIKDVIGRFFTMKGYHVERRFGWDCHGVPVELEIQKKLELHGIKAIREYGIGDFNEECRKIVLRYTSEWQGFVERSGRWVDFENQYRTMDRDFMESIWWVFKQLWDKGLVYRGLKSMPYSTAMNTPLSNFEVNQGYKDVQDPAVTVGFRLKEVSEEIGQKISEFRKVCSAISDDEQLPIELWVWTTTPWTLPSNMAVAVGEALNYVIAHSAERGTLVVVEESAVQSLVKKELIGEEYVLFAGSILVGQCYEPLFPYFAGKSPDKGFRVYGADFVEAGSGTGLVHLAAFGVDDLKLFVDEGIEIVAPVDEDGNFEESVVDFAGMYVKEADPLIIKKLKSEAKLVLHETIKHSYPHCWRTHTPLIYKPIQSWFVKVEDLANNLVANNQKINWVPDHVGSGRMGKWLEGARDWAISRSRFWGTPIPIFECGDCDHIRVMGSAGELEELVGEEIPDLHCHFIDEFRFDCDSCGSKKGMKRIPEVLDCWFESGSMPYAQSHYPFENQQKFEGAFPADFIAEGLDQTRGWFYTLNVLSTALWESPAFKNVIVNGILLAEDGKKMSKSLKNYPPPERVMEEHGADALRLYLLSSPACRAEEIRFVEKGVRDVVRQHLLPLYNSYKFLATYAEIDGWTADEGIDPWQSENILDRWILSRLAAVAEEVGTSLANYKLYQASEPILKFIDSLTNWYIRLNRRRFWSEENGPDKSFAYATLHRCLLDFARVVAPLCPFISEELFLKLAHAPYKNCKSVHFSLFPDAEAGADGEGELSRDATLEKAFSIFEEVIVCGRGLRNSLGIKTRQPLASIKVISRDPEVESLLVQLESYTKEELNVHEVLYESSEDEYVDLGARLNTAKLGKILGPKLGGKGMKELGGLVRSLSSDKLAELEAGGTFSYEGIEFGGDDVLIERRLKPEVKGAATSGLYTVLYDIVITPELEREGIIRELVNRIQRLRKDSGFEVVDRISLTIGSDTESVTSALREHREYLCNEVLAEELHIEEYKVSFDKLSGCESAESGSAGQRGGAEFDFDGNKLVVLVEKR